MRVLMISDPQSVHTVNWVDGLRAQGVHVDVLYENASRKPNDEIKTLLKCELIQAPSGKRLAIQSLKRFQLRPVFKDLITRNTLHQRLNLLGPIVRERAENGEYDLIHAHGLAAAALLAHKSGFRPYTISIWGSDILITPSSRPYMMPLMKDALEDSSFIHVQGNLGSSVAIEMCPECRDKVVVQTWGADVEAFSPGLDNNLLKNLNLDQERVVLSFRGLYPLYRTDVILRAFRQLCSGIDDVILVIGSDGPERANLEKLASELRIENSVRFIGHVDRDVMRQLFSNAHLYVQFPESDGVPITAMEAMASGLPLISSDVGDISTLVRNGENGLLVADESADALAAAMKRILDDETLRIRMSEKSRELAINHHDRTKFFRAMAQLMWDASKNTES
ncbi:MAG: glycosyltransferase family 4 protein [Candidatus Thorarchaeota archaeon]